MTENTHLNDILSNHGYEHKKVLGQGAFSSVHLCYNKKYYHNFAIKQARKHKLSSHEYQTLISLSHPNIIKIYDAFEDDTSQYLVMEYCSQGTLRQKSIFSYDKFIYYARQILEAVAYCHSKKVSHRDVKPDNIFIDQYDHVKLADFGLAKEFRHNEKTTEKCGSLMFFAPEMLQSHEIDPFKADIWALGVTFFFMATGCFPFQSESREELKQLINLGDLDFETHDVDPQIRFLISKMTTKNVKLRPTAEKLLRFPMFSQDVTWKSLMLRDKCNGRKLPPGYYTQATLYFDKEIISEFQPENAKNEVGTKTQANVLSYRGINLYPKMQRINSRHQIKKI